MPPNSRLATGIRLCIALFALTPLALAPDIALAAIEDGAGHGDAPHLDGATLGLIWAVPFAGILLSIAIFPLFAPHFWHHHFGKISAFWALAFVVPFTLQEGLNLAFYELVHTALLEYIPFIILLLSLFTVAGGVRLTGMLHGTPEVNTGMLLIGTAIASWMGTTGAAMLLIRPIIRANEWRRYKVHVVVFFIFLVANVGGSLTPLGDPPLFLGFLKGVDFFWPTTHMFWPMLLVAGILLIGFYGLDRFLYAKEPGAPGPLEDIGHRHQSAPRSNRPTGNPGKEIVSEEKLGIDGGINILLLGGVLAAVLMSGIWKPGISFEVYHVEVQLQNVLRDVLLVLIALLSLWLTASENREANVFTWFPIVEVAKLFAGIFVTIIPVIAILRAGTDGAMAAIIESVSTPAGEPIDSMYFWSTGILSSFLDNAPTYLVFFNTAGGDAQELMGPLSSTLLAISAGAVFMGANTYIGNAPNFMVRSIAEERGIAMPSFFGYMAWSCLILLPIFVLVTFVFFA